VGTWTGSSWFRIGRDSPQWARSSSFTRFLNHTRRRTTVSRTALDEWSARRRDLYLTTHNTHNRQTSMPPDRIQTHGPSRRAAADPRLRPRGHRTAMFLVFLLLIPRFLVSSFLFSIPLISKRLCTHYPRVPYSLLSFTFCILSPLYLLRVMSVLTCILSPCLFNAFNVFLSTDTCAYCV
jgi:hypothetical protein